jgi:hypothetical protein
MREDLTEYQNELDEMVKECMAACIKADELDHQYKVRKQQIAREIAARKYNIQLGDFLQVTRGAWKPKIFMIRVDILDIIFSYLNIKGRLIKKDGTVGKRIIELYSSDKWERVSNDNS